MARKVKISTIGFPYLPLDASLPHSEIWDKMKEYLTKQIKQVLPDRPDLIVLPEVCDLPDHHPPSLYDAFLNYRGNDNINFFGRIAKENHCNISFSTISRGNGDYFFNSTYLLNRNGSIAGVYDKYYVVPIEYSWNIRCGLQTPLIPLDFGKVACIICFDLNFDDLRDRYRDLKPDLIIFASMFHGGLMQQMWAQTCRAHFVGSIAHSRPSAILNPLGETLAYSTNDFNYATATANLDCATICLRDKTQIGELKKAYGPDGVTLFDPGNIGYHLLTSERDDVSVWEMIEKFGIMTYDEHLHNSRKLHNDPANQGIRV